VKLDYALREVIAAEARLALRLREMGERHRADQDVFHLTRTLAGKATESIEALDAVARRYGVADPDDSSLGKGPSSSVREEMSEASVPEEPGFVLLDDLRALHLLASAAAISWVILDQGAKAIVDEELLSIVKARQQYAVKTVKWTKTRLKEAAPQVLAS
jgi:hypothetical protein